MANVGQIDVEIRAKLDQLERGLRQANRSLDRFAREIDDVDRSARRMEASLLSAASTIAGPLAAAIGSIQLGQLALDAIRAGVAFNSFFETTEIGFRTMLGSAQEADAFLRDITNFAKSTPFEVRGLVETSQRLIAMGFEAEEVIPTLTAVGDAVAALGRGQEGINQVTLALGQMQAKQRISAEEMLQLTEAGIPAWEILAETIGTTVPEAMDLAQKGAIDFDLAFRGIIDGMTRRFGGMMNEFRDTSAGAWNEIMESAQLALAEGFDPFFQDMRQFLLDMQEDLPVITGLIEGMAENTGETLSNLLRLIQLVTNDIKRLIQSLGGAERLQQISDFLEGLNIPGAVGLGIESAQQIFDLLASFARNIEENEQEAERLAEQAGKDAGTAFAEGFRAGLSGSGVAGGGLFSSFDQLLGNIMADLESAGDRLVSDFETAMSQISDFVESDTLRIEAQRARAGLPLTEEDRIGQEILELERRLERIPEFISRSGEVLSVLSEALSVAPNEELREQFRIAAEFQDELLNQQVTLRQQLRIAEFRLANLQRERILSAFPVPSFGPGAVGLGRPSVAGAGLGGGPSGIPTASVDFVTGILDAFERVMLLSELGASSSETVAALRELQGDTLRLANMQGGLENASLDTLSAYLQITNAIEALTPKFNPVNTALEAFATELRDISPALSAFVSALSFTPGGTGGFLGIQGLSFDPTSFFTSAIQIGVQLLAQASDGLDGSARALERAADTLEAASRSWDQTLRSGQFHELVDATPEDEIARLRAIIPDLQHEIAILERRWIQFWSAGERSQRIRELENQIAEIRDEIRELETTGAAAVEARLEEILGVTTGNLQSIVSRAFSEADLDGFNRSFEEGIESAIRNAIVTATLQSELIAPLFAKLGDAIREAVEDADLTEAELRGIEGISDQIREESQGLFELLDSLGLLNDAAEDATNGMRSLARELNVPTGFKVQLARFQSTRGIIPGTNAVSVLTTGDESVGRTVVVHLTVNGPMMGTTEEEVKDWVQSAIAEADASLGQSTVGLSVAGRGGRR